jgi:alpha-beta hydrolase superfamily lysophospholipase
MSEQLACLSTASPVGRSPVLFGQAPRRCSGWLHGAPSQVGVVLCAPFGAEEESSHRSMLYLADCLARHRMCALRFDYPGCGDSEGDASERARLEDWVDAAAEAAEFLRQGAGCSEIGFVGLRLGAMVAGLASQRARARWLALWAPVSSGRRHARELRAIAALGAGAGAAQGSALFEVAGHALAADFVDGLGRLQCQDWQLGGLQRALLLERDDAVADEALRQCLGAAGMPLDSLQFPGGAAMFDEPHQALVPDLAIRQMGAWFATHAVASASDLRESGGSAPTPWRPPEPILRTSHYQERPVGLGEGRRVFGVLCTPVVEAAPRPLLVLLNAGAVHHIGPGRLHVRLARELARRGVASLRIDAPAIGDSLLPGMPCENDCYPESGVDDLLEVLEGVHRQLGFERVQLAGLCSGAHWALRVAMDPRARGVEAVAMINLRILEWGDESRRALGRSASESLRYRKAILQWASWKKLLTLRVQLRSGLQSILHHGVAAIGAALRGAGRRLGAVRANAIEQGLRRLRARRVRVGLFVGEAEPGWLLLRQAAPEEARIGLESSVIQVFAQPDADHTFGGEASKQRLFRDMHAFVTSSWPV